MSEYLDVQAFPELLERHYGSDEQKRSRLVGAIRQHDSWYIDIVRFFGPSAVDPGAVRMHYVTDSFLHRDPLVRDFSGKIEHRLRAEGRLYDGPSVMNVKAVDFRGSSPFVLAREARYGDQAASFAMDFPDPAFNPWGGTLRQYLYSTRQFGPLENNPLCVCLGVCGYLVIQEGGDKYLLQVTRSARLASLENTLGPSVAGSVEYGTKWGNLGELLVGSLDKEAGEELGLQDGEFTITPLAFAWELFRGEHPQLFAVITCEMSRAEIAARMDSVSVSEREFSRYEFLSLGKRGLADDVVRSLSFEGKMAYYLLEEWKSSSSDHSGPSYHG